MTYRRTYWQSLSNSDFRPRFWKKHQGYSSRFCQKMAFRQGKWKRTVFCLNVRLYILKLCTKNESRSMLSFPKNFSVCIMIYMKWAWLIFSSISGKLSKLWSYATTWHIDVHIGKGLTHFWTIFINIYERYMAYLSQFCLLLLQLFPQFSYLVM